MSDQIIREIPLIARYSRHNEDADWRFRSYLKAHPTLSDSKLDRVVEEETERVWAQIDCTKCANCCKTLQIAVDAADITRLARRLGVKRNDFVKQYVLTDESDHTQYFASTPCQFLGEDNRCTVYEDRPKACQDYPYLRKARFRSRTISMISNCSTCPIVFNVWQALKARLWRRRR